MAYTVYPASSGIATSSPCGSSSPTSTSAGFPLSSPLAPNQAFQAFLAVRNLPNSTLPPRLLHHCHRVFAVRPVYPHKP